MTMKLNALHLHVVWIAPSLPSPAFVHAASFPSVTALSASRPGFRDEPAEGVWHCGWAAAVCGSW